MKFKICFLALLKAFMVDLNSFENSLKFSKNIFENTKKLFVLIF